MTQLKEIKQRAHDQIDWVIERAWMNGINDASKSIVNHVLQNYAGMAEAPGANSHPAIKEMIESAMPWVEDVDDSKIAWCAIFISHVLKEMGLIDRYYTLARDLLKVGVEVNEPQMGDLVVFWRGQKNGWKGHVGIVLRIEGDRVCVLGGNQDNQVTIKWYSVTRLLGYRRINI